MNNFFISFQFSRAHKAVTQADSDSATWGPAVYTSVRADGTPGVAGVLPLRAVSRESESEIGETNREEWQAAAAKIPETDSGDGAAGGLADRRWTVKELFLMPLP